jgi:hypothetical protein
MANSSHPGAMRQEPRRGKAKQGQQHFVPLPKMLQIGILKGQTEEREAVIEFLENFVCFDHVKLSTCEHSSCYEVRRIQEKLNKGVHRER